MSAIEKLDDHNILLVAKAWIHNQEILGLTREGNLVILAKIVGESEDSIFNVRPEGKKRPSRKSQPKTHANTETTEELAPTEVQ